MSVIETIKLSADNPILWDDLPTEIPMMRGWAWMVAASGSITKAKIRGDSGHPDGCH